MTVEPSEVRHGQYRRKSYETFVLLNLIHYELMKPGPRPSYSACVFIALYVYIPPLVLKK